MKALGTGWNHGVRWHDVEVTRQPRGRRTLIFHGKAGEFAAPMGAVEGTGHRTSHIRELGLAANQQSGFW
jgi:phosphopantetheinyl transferase (holo-ACP synthase)